MLSVGFYRRLKGIWYMLYSVIIRSPGDRKKVKTNFKQTVAVIVKKSISSTHHIHNLTGPHSFERVRILITPRLNFRKNIFISSLSDYIYFQMTQAPVAFLNRKALTHKGIRSNLLAPSACVVMPRHSATCARTHV